jgi:hypothetical protein
MLGNKIITTQKEIQLINELIENDFRFSLDVNNDSDDPILVIKLNNLNLCVDINYLIFSDDIDELRFYNLNDLIDYLKSN